MDVPHWPYWRQNARDGVQIWYTDMPERPFVAPDADERVERAITEMGDLAKRLSPRGEKPLALLEIAPDLRLVQLERVPEQALSWYQDPETLWMIDGRRDPYTTERLAQMYSWLSEHGELWFIEVMAREGWRVVGDVTLCPDDLPVVIGEKGLRGRHIGRRVVAALCERARELGRDEVRVAEIYDWNEPSQRCFAAAGFSPYERTERGSRWRRAL